MGAYAIFLKCLSPLSRPRRRIHTALLRFVPFTLIWSMFKVTSFFFASVVWKANSAKPRGPSELALTECPGEHKGFSSSPNFGQKGAPVPIAVFSPSLAGGRSNRRLGDFSSLPSGLGVIRAVVGSLFFSFLNPSPSVFSPAARKKGYTPSQYPLFSRSVAVVEPHPEIEDPLLPFSLWNGFLPWWAGTL